MFNGIYATPQTPFDKNGNIIEEDLRKEVHFCLESKVNGIAALVMSAEFSALTDDERLKIAEIIIEEVNHNVPVIIGVAGTSIHSALKFSKHASEIGADAIIALPPYVNKDSLEGIFKYYYNISESVNIPIFIQNASPPMGSDLSTEFMLDLVKRIKNIEYIKEESFCAPHSISKVINIIGNNIKGVFGGNGGKNIINEYMRGASGWIIACEFCDIMVNIYNLLLRNNIKKAREIHNKFLPLIEMETLHTENFAKEILRSRRILSTNYTRIAGQTILDKFDLIEIDELLKEVENYFKIFKPF